ncbi:hypothetical protein SDC9_74669 [bioreactor metagenome]|uniref:Uncharacterized protein n=1 Tax=bioreactor metagenome TaxID=1076179 RepID=A0A644YI67_9ZZZZ
MENLITMLFPLAVELASAIAESANAGVRPSFNVVPPNPLTSEFEAATVHKDEPFVPSR